MVVVQIQQSQLKKRAYRKWTIVTVEGVGGKHSLIKPMDDFVPHQRAGQVWSGGDY